jgi:hypothetical protein
VRVSARKQADFSEQASKFQQASKQASDQASKQASKQTSKSESLPNKVVLSTDLILGV